MRYPMTHGLLTIVAVASLMGCGQGRGDKSSVLSTDGKRVVEYLVNDWNKQFRSTSIPHAMANLGMTLSDDLRIEILNHFRNNQELAMNLRYWGPNNYVLTNIEKRIAKHVLNTYRDEGRIPGIGELSEIIGLDYSQMEERLAFLAKVGFMKSSGEDEIPYTLAGDASLWGGPLRHNYHTVHIDGDKPFDAW